MRGRVNTILMLCLLAVAVLVPTAAKTFRRTPGRDSGVFLYTGWRILEGDVPYRDVWDHKPPLIHYINAAGLFLGRDTLWGVWAIEALSLCAAAALGFVLMRRAWGDLPALFGSMAWLMTCVVIFEYSNVTEMYALPIQFLIMLSFQRSEEKGDIGWRGVVIGLGFALLFFLRQNLVGAGVAAVVCFVVSRAASRRWHELSVGLEMLALGAVSVAVAVIAYFAARGALGSFWNEVFTYNFAYVAGTGGRARSVASGLLLLARSGLSVLALAGWVWGAAAMCRGGRGMSKAALALLSVALVGLPVELVLAGASGRSFPHYYIAWLPVLGVLSAFLASAVISAIMRGRPHEPVLRPWMVAVCLVLAGVPLAVRFAPRATAHATRRAGNPVASYIMEKTGPGDSVLIWGAEARLNFLARRRAPTRFVYQYPLYMRGYQKAGHVRRLLRDLSLDPPALIIDASPSSRSIPPIDTDERSRWRPTDRYDMPPMMDLVFDHILRHYEISGTVGPGKWPVYVRRPDNAPRR